MYTVFASLTDILPNYKSQPSCPKVRILLENAVLTWLGPLRASENRSLRIFLGWFFRLRTGQRWMVASNDIFVDQEHYSQNPDI